MRKKNKSNPSDKTSLSSQNASGSFYVGNNQRRITAQFGHVIKEKRERLGITQTELANLSHLNRSYLSEVEHGLASISLERAERIAKALGCRLRDLLS